MADAITNCQKCGGNIAFPKELAGKEASCPHCNENILLPKSKHTAVWAIAGVVAIGISCFGAVFVSQHKSKPIKSQPQPISSIAYTNLSLDALQAKATSGDIKAQVILGWRYYDGEGVATNQTEATNWWSKAAEQGDTSAMTSIGDAIFDAASQSFQNAHAKDNIDPATGLPTSYLSITNIPEECFNWYRKAAELGDTNAMWQLVRNLNLGASFLVGGATDPATGLPMPQPNKETIRWLRKLTETSDTEAMIQLGSIYIHGYNVETNLDEGIKLFEKSGELGNLSAYSTLAQLYETGDGVPKDIYQAIGWYKKAASKDDSDAELALAKLYNNNEMVKDLEQSFKWYLTLAQKSSTHTNYGAIDWKTGLPPDYQIEDSLIPVAKAYDKGLGVTQDKDEALKWYMKAAEAGISEAQFRLGVKYDLGDGVLKDKQKALQWYLKAANKSGIEAILSIGVAESQRNIGYLYQSGDGVSKDAQQAFGWFLKAAGNGSSAAQFEVAEAYSSGVGILQDKQEAFNWYQKAANGGNKSAQIKLAQFYFGQVNSPANSPENRIAAHVWLNLAAAQGYEDATPLRNSLVKKMLPKEIAEAQREEKDFSAGTSLITNTMPALGALAFDAPAASTPDISDTPAFEVLNVTAKPTEQNDVWWRYGYRVTVRNNGQNSEGQWFHIQFLDAQGYVIDTATTDRTAISPGATEIITGETLLQLPGAARVAKLKATWNP
jgi:TPR repeat protein